MNTITRGGGRRAALTATALAVLALGLAGCQTGVVDRTTDDPASIAQQAARTSAASQARYEGLAEYWEQRAQRADAVREGAQPRVVVDRLEQQLLQDRTVTQVRVVPDRLEQELSQDRTPTQPRVVVDRLDGRE
jgi:hypothetical protein